MKVIQTSTAKDLTAVKPSKKLRESCPPGTIYAFTKTGSACKRTLEQWIQYNVRERFPDLKDEDGKRVLLKLDGGPALPLNPDWLEARAKEGIEIFPGLPNGSAINQVGEISSTAWR